MVFARASCKQCVMSSGRQIAKTFHGADEGPPDPSRITRTPESAFDDVPQPFAPHYFQVFDPVYNVSANVREEYRNALIYWQISNTTWHHKFILPLLSTNEVFVNV